MAKAEQIELKVDRIRIGISGLMHDAVEALVEDLKQQRDQFEKAYRTSEKAFESLQSNYNDLEGSFIAVSDELEDKTEELKAESHHSDELLRQRDNLNSERLDSIKEIKAYRKQLKDAGLKPLTLKQIHKT